MSRSVHLGLAAGARAEHPSKLDCVSVLQISDSLPLPLLRDLSEIFEEELSEVIKEVVEKRTTSHVKTEDKAVLVREDSTISAPDEIS